MTDVPVGKLSKTCDSCKARKVRCTKSDEAGQTACHNCISRKTPCHYSYAKPPRKRKQPPGAEKNEESNVSSPETVAPSKRLATPSIRDGPVSTTTAISPHLSSSNGLLGAVSYGEAEGRVSLAGGTDNRKTTSAEQVLSPKLYVDLLLADRQTPAKRRDENSPNKLSEFFGPSCNLSFFSASRVHSLSNRLGHSKLNRLMETIASVANSRMRYTDRTPHSNSLRGSKTPLQITAEFATSCMRSYFEQVHPVYPFLDKEAFERKVHQQTLSPSSADKVWSALYHTVLAIGCQYNDGGSFDPGNGQAWSLFKIALSCFQDILMTKGSLMAVQALTAMAIFSTTVSAWPFESLMISEAAKMAQNMGYNKATGPNDSVCHRTFWVVYSLEKTSCFITGRTSVLMDSDIGCPIPYVPESVFGNYDWFLAFARYARLVSRIYSNLFSVSSVGKTTGFYHACIQRLRDELETWRMSIPERYRPGEPLRARALPGALAVSIALHTHYLYLNALLTLLRISLHVGADGLGTAHQLETKKLLMKTACTILDLTKHIEVATYTSLWILALMPLSALFIIFDLVVHNPTHPETNNNLALLDVASGHFSRLEYASRGTLPGSLVAEFAHIARQYVRDLQLGGHNNYNNSDGKDTQGQARLPNNIQSQSQSHGQLPNDVSSATAVFQPATTTATAAPISSRTPQQISWRHQSLQGSVPQQAQQYSGCTSNGNLINDGNGTESLFFPLVDDPSYMPEEELQLLGIDVMDLFESVNPVLHTNMSIT
ncbi:hypothetical protein VTN77DRAFT_1301 [Rasamsonia byssochlamydoides]|uniref:uncharacterized protein n=1 Tax=Rasamsonia byssochlamydoides TaxID=89139 RepID=UPI003743211A